MVAGKKSQKTWREKLEYNLNKDAFEQDSKREIGASTT
jgi:hypothetical protein